MSCQLANGWERIVGDTVAIPVRITRAETKERVPYVVINSVRRRFMSTMQHLVAAGKAGGDAEPQLPWNAWVAKAAAIEAPFG